MPQRWAEGAVVYQIYPRSFQDSNGDGVGDIPGITSRLDYLKDLGVTAIWLSPFYPSPMADFGYDVADYCGVDPLFGDLKDFDEMLKTAHAKSIKVMVDFVPNHSSDEHAWFKESASSKHNSKHDWYVWRDAKKDGSLPNNWRDVLTGGPAWQWHEGRQQYYLHSFHVKQPDLNWSNPALRKAMKTTMRFWLDRGVDGFRVDAVPYMAKHPLLLDDASNPDYLEGRDPAYDAITHENSHGWPLYYAYLAEMADVLDEPAYQAAPRFMVTEDYPGRREAVQAYTRGYVAMNPLVAAPFNFEGLKLPWQAAAWREFLESFHASLDQIGPDCIASYAFGNHDNPRLSSRYGDKSRAVAVLLLTLPGMSFIYNGDELGMRDVEIAPELVQDPAAVGDPHLSQGRDPERTPMQWSAEAQAGFSSASKTWLPLAPDFQCHNVATELADDASLLNLYRQLGQLRAGSAALRSNDIRLLTTPPDVLGYERRTDDETYQVYINFSKQIVKLVFNGQRRLSTHQLADPSSLQPDEAVVYRVA